MRAPPGRRYVAQVLARSPHPEKCGRYAPSLDRRAAAAAAATGAVAVALFGSCPTFYAAENGAFVLEAEKFSYSISPLFESRDVDLLGARPNERGELTLEVRNAALEIDAR